MFFELLCETKNMQENFKHQKPQQIGIIENTEDEEGKRSASTSEQQRKCRLLIKIKALVCSSTFSAKQRTQEAKWKKKQKEKTQKPGGQMKKCGVKNLIFRCDKNAEDGEGNEKGLIECYFDFVLKR